METTHVATTGDAPTGQDNDDNPFCGVTIPLAGTSSVTDEARRALCDLRLQRKLAERAPAAEGVTLLDHMMVDPDAVQAIERAASQLARLSQAERHAFSSELVNPQHDPRYLAAGSPLWPFRVDAKVDIPRYTILGIYEGVTKTNREVEEEQDRHLDKNSARLVTLDYLFDLTAVTANGVCHLVIDAGPVGDTGIAQRMNMGALFNAPDPGQAPNVISLNAVAAGTCAHVYNTSDDRIQRIPIVLLVAIQDIKQHEQALLSYGPAYWDSRKHLTATLAKVKSEKAAALVGDEGGATAHALAPLGAPQAAPQYAAAAAGGPSARASGGIVGAGAARGAARASIRLPAPQQAGEGGDPGGDPDDGEDEGSGGDGGRGRRGGDKVTRRGPCSIFLKLAAAFPDLFGEREKSCNKAGPTVRWRVADPEWNIPTAGCETVGGCAILCNPCWAHFCRWPPQLAAVPLQPPPPRQDEVHGAAAAAPRGRRRAAGRGAPATDDHGDDDSDSEFRVAPHRLRPAAAGFRPQTRATARGSAEESSDEDPVAPLAARKRAPVRRSAAPSSSGSEGAWLPPDAPELGGAGASDEEPLPDATPPAADDDDLAAGAADDAGATIATLPPHAAPAPAAAGAAPAAELAGEDAVDHFKRLTDEVANLDSALRTAVMQQTRELGKLAELATTTSHEELATRMRNTMATATDEVTKAQTELAEGQKRLDMAVRTERKRLHDELQVTRDEIKEKKAKATRLENRLQEIAALGAAHRLDDAAGAGA